VDGCRGGWLCAHIADDSSVTWTWNESFRDVRHAGAVVAIDIPIGLPDRGARRCDVQARRLLGARRSSVFPAPVRPVLACRTYQEARALLAALGGASMSAQAFGIVAAVRDVDDAVTAADNDRVIEAHPELVFRHLTGRELAPKRSGEGAAQRLTALQTLWPDIADIVATAPRPARQDDALDAVACAVAAMRWSRGDATVLGDGEFDSTGKPMRIAY